MEYWTIEGNWYVFDERSDREEKLHNVKLKWRMKWQVVDQEYGCDGKMWCSHMNSGGSIEQLTWWYGDFCFVTTHSLGNSWFFVALVLFNFFIFIVFITCTTNEGLFKDSITTWGTERYDEDIIKVFKIRLICIEWVSKWNKSCHTQQFY